MGISIKKVRDFDRLFKLFGDKLKQGPNPAQSEDNVNKLNGLISVDEVEPLIKIPQGRVPVSINGQDTPPIWFGNVQEAFLNSRNAGHVGNVRNSVLHDLTDYNIIKSWIQGDKAHILHQRLDDGLLGGYIKPGSQQADWFKSNTDFKRIKRAETYLDENPTTELNDWPIDINPKGEFNLDYGRFDQTIKRNIEEANKGLLEVEQKNTLEQMKQEALNRLKR